MKEERSPRFLRVLQVSAALVFLVVAAVTLLRGCQDEKAAGFDGPRVLLARRSSLREGPRFKHGSRPQQTFVLHPLPSPDGRDSLL